MSRIAYIPSETEELREWHQELGKDFFQKIGVKHGDYILDIGSGIGTYTLPAAQVVGKKGKVFAVDNEQICINELIEATIANNLEKIIKPIKTDGGFSFPIENESIDYVLLIDFIGVVLYHSRNLKTIEVLFREINRIIKASGIVVIIFKHVKQWRQSKEEVISIISKKFSLENQLNLIHVHWDFLEKDMVYLYKKK